MGITLTSKTVSSTYDSLLKLSDNDQLTGAFKLITDGLGNDSGISINNSGDVNISGTLVVGERVNTPILQLTGGTGTQGTMSWNEDEETVDLIQNGSTLQLGQEVQIHCKNQTGATIPDGTPVYVTGTLGASGRLTIAPMIADGSIQAKYFIGVTTETIANGDDGKVTTFGKIRGLNTAAYSEGQTLWVSATTAGAFVTTRPVAPNLDLEVAIVINSHVNNGTLFVRSSIGHYLGTAHDVNISSVAENDLLVYKTNRWVNSKSIGDLSAANVTLSGYLRGPATFVIDPAAYGDETGLVQILGDLRVDGTTTTINSTTISVSDKNITLAKDAATAGDANGAGITIAGASATLTYLSATDDFTFNKNVNATRFIGDLTGDVTGNADTADALSTARNIALDGSVTGNADFDGSGNITITTTTNHNHDDIYYTETEVGNFFSGSTTITGYNKTNWDSAYSYSQIGHLPLTGGTLTGDFYISNAEPKIRLKENDTTNLDKEISLIGGAIYIKNLNDDNTATNNMIVIDNSGNFTASGTLSAVGYNKTNWDTAYDDKINSGYFDSNTGDLVLTRQDDSTLEINFDDRYVIANTGNFKTNTYSVNSGLGTQRYLLMTGSQTDQFFHITINRAYDYGDNDQTKQQIIYQRRNSGKNLRWRLDGDIVASQQVFIEIYARENGEDDVWIVCTDYARPQVYVEYDGFSWYGLATADTPTGTLIKTTELTASNKPNWEEQVGLVKTTELYSDTTYLRGSAFVLSPNNSSYDTLVYRDGTNPHVLYAGGGTSTQWNTAYTYSQVGHLPLTGGTITGNLDVDGIIDNTRNNTNAAPPSTSDHTAGTRIKLWDSSDVFFYALGIESGHIWSNADIGFKWYQRAVEKMSLSDGNLTIAGTLSASGYNNTNWDTAYTYSQVGHLPLAGGQVTGTIKVGTTAGSWGSVFIGTGNGAGWSSTFSAPYIGSNGGSTGSLIMLHNPHIPFRTDNAASASYDGRAGLRCAIDVDATNWWDIGLAGDFFHIYKNGTGELFRLNNNGNVVITGTITANGYNKTNWDTAYGWGDHADAGYLTSYTETDTLLSVTTRGASTTQLVAFTGKATFGSRSSASFNGNVVGLTINNVAELRSLNSQDPPALTWHYESLATRHILMDAYGNLNVVAPTSENGGVAIFKVNGHQVIDASNIGSQSVASATSAGTANNALALSGYALDGATSVATRIFNNKGQGHTTYTDFNTVMTPGPNYIQGGTNGPTGTASQWYGFMLGLGSEYNTETGNANGYASQLYWNRQNQGGLPYLYARDMEQGVFGSWRKMGAGYADTAGSALTADAASTASYATTSGSTNSIIWGNISGIPTTLQGYGITGGYINGDVGIGRSTLYEKLEVGGNIRLGNYTDSGTKYIGYGNNTFATQFIAGISIESTTLGGNYSQKLNFATHHYGVSAGVRMTLSESGNLGINVAGPAYKLQIAEDGHVYSVDPHASGVNLHSTGNFAAHYQTNFDWYTGAIGDGTFRMRLDSSGRLSIGVTSTTRILETKDAGITGDNAWFGTGSVRMGGGADAGSNQVLSLAPGRFGMDAPGVANGRFVVEENGRVGIGRPTPLGRLDVDVIAGDENQVRISASENIFKDLQWKDTTSGEMWIWSHRTNSNANKFMAWYYNGSAYNTNPALTLATDNSIGINTQTPNQKLDVRGFIVSDSQSNGSESAFYLGNSSHGLSRPNLANDITLYTTAGDVKISASTASTTHLIVKNSGYIGVGTTDPDTKFQVAGTGATGISARSNSSGDSYYRLYLDSTVYSDYFVDRATGSAYLRTTTSAPLIFSTNLVDKMRITSGGSLLLGDNIVPGESVWKGTAVFGKNGTDKVITGYLSSSTNGAIIGGHNSALNAWGPLAIAGTELRFNYEQTRVMTMTSSGLGVNRTSVVGSKIHVEGYLTGGTTGSTGSPNRTSMSNVIAFEARSTGGGGEPSICFHKEGIYTMYLEGQNSGRGFVFKGAGGETAANIYSQGDVVAYYSDMRLKTKIGDIENPIEKVNALNGFYYEPNEIAQSYGYVKERRIGLSAQEVKEVVPEAVSDAAIGDGYMSVDYSKIVPLLVEAIKEQQKQIDELKAIINGITN